MEIKKDIIEKIDILLQMAFDDGQIFFSKEVDDNTEKAFRICKSLNLIRQKQSGLFELDEKGVFVIQDGGIEKYLTNIRTEKELDLVIKNLTTKRLKYDILYNIMYVVIGGILASIPNIVSGDRNSKEVELLTKSVSEINELNDSCQKQLNQTNILILGLKNEIDSLKAD